MEQTKLLSVICGCRAGLSTGGTIVHGGHMHGVPGGDYARGKTIYRSGVGCYYSWDLTVCPYATSSW